MTKKHYERVVKRFLDGTEYIDADEAGAALLESYTDTCEEEDVEECLRELTRAK